MKKWPIFLGLFLLTIGILLKTFTSIGVYAVLIILSGVGFKIYYIISKIRRGEYKPGFEMVLLFIGLVIFLTGVYFKSHPSAIKPVYLMAPGILLKVLFVTSFIKKGN